MQFDTKTQEQRQPPFQATGGPLSADILQSVDNSLVSLANHLLKIQQQLLGARNQRTIKSAEELRKFQYRLDELESEHKDNLVWRAKNTPKGQIPKGQGVLNELLDDCHDLINTIIDTLPKEQAIKKRTTLKATSSSSLEEIHPSLKTIENHLNSVKMALLKLKDLGTQAVKDASELRKYQYRLDDIETEYKQGLVWRGKQTPSGEVVPGQAALTTLVDDCHDLIDQIIDALPYESGLQKRAELTKAQSMPPMPATKLQSTSTSSSKAWMGVSSQNINELVHPSLKSVADHLLNLRKHLIEARATSGIKDAEELRKFQFGLDELENQNKVNNLVWRTKDTPANEVVAGQAALNELLDDCHDIINTIIDSLPLQGTKVIFKRTLPTRKGTSSTETGSKLEMPQNIVEKGKEAHNIPSSHMKHEAGQMKRQQFQQQDTTMI